MAKQNNQLTMSLDDRQQTTLHQIQQGGSPMLQAITALSTLTKKEFLIFNYSLPKLREVIKTEQGVANLEFFISGLIALIGIKGSVDILNKRDVSNLMATRYGNLTMADIYKAFEMERYNEFKERTDHYNLFNASYVSTILRKYSDFVQEFKFEHNISPPIQDNALKIEQNSQAHVKQIMNDGILRKFEEYKETGVIESPFKHIFEELVLRGHIPYPRNAEYLTNPQTKVDHWYKEKWELAKKQAQRRANAGANNVESTFVERQSYKDALKEIENNASAKIDLCLYEIVLKGVFDKLISQGKNINEFLK